MQVRGIPSLVILEPSGEVIATVNEMDWPAVDVLASRSVVCALFSFSATHRPPFSGTRHPVNITHFPKVITTDGRQAVAEDPEGKKFPWKLCPRWSTHFRNF